MFFYQLFLPPMPIRGLENVKKSTLNSWVVKAQAHVLKDSILAIDGFWFLRKYVIMGNICDLFVSKCDERFLAPVLKLIKMANSSKFQILWVWDGMDFKKPVNESKKVDTAILHAGYDYLKKGDIKNANQTFKQILDYEDIIVQINKLMKQFGHEAVRAPYSATAQIAYFLRSEICNYAFCKTDTLIFEGVDKIITDLHLENVEHFMITAFNRKDFMKSFELSYQNFRTLAFALGCEFCPTIPEYADNFIFENIITLIKTLDFDGYIEEKSKTNKAYINYMKMFYTAFVLVDFHPVMKEDGRIAFFKDTEVVPSDFETCFGKRLPFKLYEALFFCKVSVGVLESISKNQKKDAITNISYKIIKSKFVIDGEKEELKEDLSTLLTKNLTLYKKLSKSLQILIHFLAAENLLDKSCIDKLICTANLKKNLITNNEKMDFDCPYDILEFVYGCNKVAKKLKEVCDIYNLLYAQQSKDGLNFEMDIYMFSYLYYKKYKNSKEDNSIRYINNYINDIRDFVKSNLSINVDFKKISYELMNFGKN